MNSASESSVNSVLWIIGNSPLFESCDFKSQCTASPYRSMTVLITEKAIWKGSFAKIPPSWAYGKTWEIHAQSELWSYSRRHNELRAFWPEKEFLLLGTWTRKGYFDVLRWWLHLFVDWNRRNITFCALKLVYYEYWKWRIYKVDLRKVLEDNVRVTLQRNVQLCSTAVKKEIQRGSFTIA